MTSENRAVFGTAVKKPEQRWRKMKRRLRMSGTMGFERERRERERKRERREKERERWRVKRERERERADR